MKLSERLSCSLVIVSLLAGCAAPPLEQSSGTSAAQTDGKGGDDSSYDDSSYDDSSSDDGKGSANGDGKSGGSSGNSRTIRICNQRPFIPLVGIMFADIDDVVDHQVVWTGSLATNRCTTVPMVNRQTRIYYDYADHRRYTNSISTSYDTSVPVQAEPGPYSPEDEWQRW